MFRPTVRSFSTLGLFSIPELQKPSDFVSYAATAIRTCDALRHSLSQSPNLYTLDQISQSVCNVIDAAELARSTHTDPAWRDAAQRAFSILSDYMGQLNSDELLYRSLVHLITNNSPTEWTEEEQRFATLLRAEFERDGIQLPNTQRLQCREIQRHINELEHLFGRNIVNSSNQNNIMISSLYSNNAMERKEAYMEYHTSVPENIPVLQSLVQRRHEYAQALGFETYADFFLRDKMAQSPKTVLAFLYQLQEQTSTYYQHDLQRLQHVKERVGGSAVLEPWDIVFYVNIIKHHSGLVMDLSEYFTMKNCIKGMKLLVNRLFGLEMEEDVLSDQERWDGTTPGIRRFSFRDAKGSSLGTMYLDLLPRPGKYNHAAHFTVRCGCVINGNNQPPQYQLPVIALVCNLSASDDSSRLSHPEVETLYHEFGHALHSLLSRTKFQHMSGTRAVIDFVETPSHLIENFVWDPQFLKVLAVHEETGEPLPDDKIARLRHGRQAFQAIERQNQIISALFDQMLFGKAESADRKNPTEIFAGLHKRFGVPYAENTHWYTRFGHLVTYGAGYYGYLYSQVFASDIWTQCFENDSLSRLAGERLWRKMLIHGGARDPTLMLTDLLGRPPKIGVSVPG